MSKLLAIIIDCLVASNSLLLVVLGFYLIYGIMKVINMAHGDLVMLGSYFTAYFSHMLGSFWLGVALSSLLCFAFGFIIERGIIRRLYEKDNVMTLLATWGISLIIIECVRLFFGASGIYVDPPIQGTITFFNSPFSVYNIVIIGISTLSIIFILLLFQYTKFGIILRAAIENQNRASLFSINVRKLYSLTFAFGCGLAGLAGAVLSPISSITPNMGIDFAFLSFLVVICGGFKSFFSPILGAVVVATSRTILSSFFGATTATIGMLIIILLIIFIRPGGILPEKI